MKTKKTAIIYAILAAALYALNAPISKLLLSQIPSTMMAGLLYLGAGLGMFFMEKLKKNKDELPLTKKELPYTIAMVVLDIAAPIFLMIGLTKCSAANASLLNNFEIVLKLEILELNDLLEKASIKVSEVKESKKKKLPFFPLHFSRWIIKIKQ